MTKTKTAEQSPEEVQKRIMNNIIWELRSALVSEHFSQADVAWFYFHPDDLDVPYNMRHLLAETAYETEHGTIVYARISTDVFPNHPALIQYGEGF